MSGPVLTSGFPVDLDRGAVETFGVMGDVALEQSRCHHGFHSAFYAFIHFFFVGFYHVLLLPFALSLIAPLKISEAFATPHSFKYSKTRK